MLDTKPKEPAKSENYSQASLNDLSKNFIPAIAQFCKDNQISLHKETQTLMIELYRNCLMEMVQVNSQIENSHQTQVANQIVFSMSSWEIFTRLIKQNPTQIPYTQLESTYLQGLIYELLKTSFLISIKYNSDTPYWNRDFAILYADLFLPIETVDLNLLAIFSKLPFVVKETSKLIPKLKADILKIKDSKIDKHFNSLDEELQNLANLQFNSKRGINYRYLEQIESALTELNNAITKLGKEGRLTKKYQSAFQNIQKISMEILKVEEVVFSPIKKLTLNLNELELNYLKSLNWEVSKSDLQSEKEYYQSIQVIKQMGFDYVSSILNPRQTNTAEKSYTPGFASDQSEVQQKHSDEPKKKITLQP